MKKTLTGFTGLICLAGSLFANEVQVFSSKTLPIAIDPGSKVEKLFYGTSEEFSKEQAEIMKSITLKNGATYGLQATGATLQGATTGDVKGGVIGLASVAAVTLGKMGYDYFTADNDYVYLSLVTNSNQQQTMIYTLIVANNSLSDEEGEKIAEADQQTLFKD